MFGKSRKSRQDSRQKNGKKLLRRRPQRGAFDEAQAIAQELARLREEIADCHTLQERSEKLFHYLQRYAPDLLTELEAKAQDKITAFTPASETVVELQRELQTKIFESKPVCRRFETKAQIGNWEFSSTSGGMGKAFDLKRVLAAGLGDIEVGGKPLIKTSQAVDPKVWAAAVKKKLIDVKDPKVRATYTEKPNTRRASLKYVDDHQHIGETKKGPKGRAKREEKQQQQQTKG